MERNAFGRLIPILVAAGVNGILAITAVASYGILIFSGALSDYASTGIAIAFVSALIVAFIMALLSSYKGTLGIPNPNAVAILGFMAASLSGSLQNSVSSDVICITVIAAISLSCVITGAFLLGLGYFRLGKLIRFIPYPVVGGFMAGSGWLLTTGSLRMMIGRPLDWASSYVLLQPEVIIRWFPVCLYAVIIFVLMKRIRHFLALPIMLIGGVALFYILLLLAGTSSGEASSQGWLLGPFPEEGLWQSLSFGKLSSVDWGALWGTIPSAGTLAIVSVISLLLIASGIELAVREDVDLDRELRAAGVANLISAVPGGVVGYHNLAATILNNKMGAGSRWVGIIISGLIGVTLFVGADPLSYFPKPVLAGLLLFFGIGFLYEWIVDARKRLPVLDYAIVILILVIIATIGFLQGIAVGVLAGIVLFVVNYSRIDVVKYSVSGAEYQSNVERPPYQRRVLGEKGEQLHILKLHGFIFFGTANTLFGQIRERAAQPDLPSLRYVVLDFRLVTGLDSSAIMSFARMKQFAQGQRIALCLSSVQESIEDKLKNGGLLVENDPDLRLFEDLDRAIEWCENAILSSEGAVDERKHESLSDLLKQNFPASADTSAFMQYLDKEELGSKHYLMHQGETSDSLCFIESGQVTVLLELGGARKSRLRTIGPGNVVGEIAFYLGFPRTASVMTEKPSTTFRLTKHSMGKMEKEHPELAAAFHQFMARFLSERLAYTDKLLQAVLD